MICPVIVGTARRTISHLVLGWNMVKNTKLVDGVCILNMGNAPVTGTQRWEILST